MDGQNEIVQNELDCNLQVLEKEHEMLQRTLGYFTARIKELKVSAARGVPEQDVDNDGHDGHVIAKKRGN